MCRVLLHTWILLTLVSLVCMGGCVDSATQQLKSVSQLLNEGNVSGCTWLTAGYPPYGSLSGIYARGTVTIQECQEVRRP